MTTRTETEQAIYDSIVHWHCSIGSLVDPQLYPEASAFLAEGDVLELFHSGMPLPAVVRDHIGLLSRLQQARDSRSLTAIARDFGLDTHTAAHNINTEQLQ